jgi:dolichol kinase
VGTGPIFFLVWPLFDGTITGSILAAALPLLMTSKFALIGLGALKDDDAVRTMSRTGDKKELLRGPLAYGAVFVITTLLFWKDFRSAIVIFSLCFGDGFAEPIGRIFGANNKLPWAKRSGKSLAGTMGFLTVSVAATSLLVAYLSKSAGRSTIVDDVLLLLPRITATNFFAALAESLTAGDLDNVAVFLAAVVADIGYCRLFPKTTASSQEWMKTVM